MDARGIDCTKTVITSHENRHCAVTTAAFGQGSGPVGVSAYATCITAYQPNRLMSTGFVPSSVSTVCVTRQPWAAAKSRHFCPGWRTSARFRSPRIVRHWRPCCSSTARCCARICPGFREIGRPSAVAALPVVLTPDEVVRILGFLEGEHRLFAQLLYGTACGSVRVCNAGQGSDFDHGTIIVREGKGSKDRALMLPESLAPSLREQLSRARAWWLKDRAGGRSGVALPDALERKYPRAGHSSGRFWFLRSTRIRPIHGAVSCVAITCMTRPFSAPSNVP